MEKCENNLLELLKSILGDAGAAAEISLLKSLKEDLEKKKSPEFLKYVSTSTLDNLEDDIEKTPDMKEKVPTEKEQEGTLTMPKSKSLDERLEAEMERCITEEDLRFIYNVFCAAARQYRNGDDAFVWPYMKANHAEVLKILIEFITPWLNATIASGTPVMDRTLEEEKEVDILPEVLKKVPNTILLRWGKYLDDTDLRKAWDELKFDDDEEEDEVVGDYIDALKDTVIRKLVNRLHEERKITIDDSEIMSEVIDAIGHYCDSYGLIRVNDTIRLI